MQLGVFYRMSICHLVYVTKRVPIKNGSAIYMGRLVMMTKGGVIYYFGLPYFLPACLCFFNAIAPNLEREAVRSLEVGMSPRFGCARLDQNHTARSIRDLQEQCWVV